MACPHREHKVAPGRCQEVVEFCVPLNEKACIKVVSKGLKQHEALTVVGTIRKCVDVVLRDIWWA